MTEVPKIVPNIVFDRLRAAPPDRAHPEADLLTAFTERTLSGTEREGVIEHLALCGECREVIALALPAADVAALADETAADRATSIPVCDGNGNERTWLTLAWPNLIWTNVWANLVRPRLGGPGLRWAALAAGVVVAASVLLMHPGKLNQVVLPSSNRQVATTSPMEQSASSTKADETQLKPETQLSQQHPPPRLQAGPQTGQIVMPRHQAASTMLLADNKKQSAQAGRPPAGVPTLDISTRGGANETVEVASGTPAVTTESSPQGTLMARSDAPAIEKAKPALQSQDTKASEAQPTSAQASEQQNSGTAVAPGLRLHADVISTAKLAPAASRALAQHNVIWTITGGVLQRSSDSGQSWQDALRPNHPLLCSASRDKDIWTGGQAGTLFHSGNGGVTWVQVRPSIKDQQLSSDITHIDLPDDAHSPDKIVVSTGSSEIWSSADGGTTWEKK
jgi:hypothetical protein